MRTTWSAPVAGKPRPAWTPPAGRKQALAELEHLLGFHISLAHTAIKAHFQIHSAALGLTHKQIAILWLVDGCPGIIQTDLARMLRVKRATIWAMVGRLCARDMLERPGTDEMDARHVALNLTDHGRDVLKMARQEIDRHEAWVKQPFSAEEQRLIVRLMTRLHERPV
jgi:DNA-binding MarR family transcriptional regulator